MNIVLILFIILPIVGIVFIHKKRTEEERNIILKLIGYYLLGAFTFTLNHWMIPIGFLIFLVAFRPVVNKNVKQLAAYLGLGMYLLQVIIPPIENYIFEWPREVQASGDNFYAFEFEKSWNEILKEDSIENATLQNFKAEYSQNGEINIMKFEVVTQVEGGKVYHQYSYNPNDQAFTVHRHRIKGPWHQEGMITASRFFRKLDELDLQEIKPQNPYSWYVLQSEGRKINYGVYDSEKYILNNEGVIEVNNDELPIQGFMLTTCGKSEKTEPNRLECQERTQFFFDATYQKNTGDSFTHDDAIAVLRGNGRVNDWMDEHMGSNTRREENGKYYLKKQGQWEQVTETKFRTKIEPFELEHELRDQKWYITYHARFGDRPFNLRGVVDAKTGEILSVSFR